MIQGVKFMGADIVESEKEKLRKSSWGTYYITIYIDNYLYIYIILLLINYFFICSLDEF